MSNVSLQSLLSRRFVITGGPCLVKDLGVKMSVRLSFRKLIERCNVWLNRFRGVAFKGGMRLAKDVTRDRGFARLLLGSFPSRLHRLSESSSFFLCFRFFPLRVQPLTTDKRDELLPSCDVGLSGTCCGSPGCM